MCLGRIRITLIALLVFSIRVVEADSISPSSRPADSIKLTWPTPYAVFQRSLSNTARIPIVGHSDESGAVVDAKATLMPSYREGIDGKSGDFVEAAKLAGHDFFGSLEVPAGGWYTITIRIKSADGHVIAQRVVDKVGIGEVFVAAGHSFASNHNADKPGKASDDRVATCADWMEAPPSPLAFRHCDDPLRPGDRNRATPWTAVGDELVGRLHVPVLFICTGIGGSTAEQWRKGADDPTIKSHAYGPTRLTLQKITPHTGLRAIIWLGNENDLGAGPTAEVFSDNLRTLINDTRKDSGYAELPWIIAFDAYDPGVIKKVGAEEKLRRKERIDRGTELVLQTVPNTYDGPQTDDLGPEFRRSDADHFNEAGIRELGIRFARKIILAFLPKAPPAPQPARMP